MARPLRIELEGGLYHVTARGDRREDIYTNEADRLCWLSIFGDVCDQFNWRCHSYCQMTNHYHLVVETPEGNLSQGMRQLNGVYTQTFNRRHGLVGHLFQGRFKGILVERDAYLLELSRYVVLNPVRAGMVPDTDDWPWSSYRATVGKDRVPDWLETDWVLGHFGQDRVTARHGYMDFVRAGVGRPSIWADLRNQIYLGSKLFVQRMCETLDKDTRLGEVPSAQRRPAPKPLSAYKSESTDRDEAMVRAYRSGGYTMRAIADHFGVHYATVSRAVKKSNQQQDG